MTKLFRRSLAGAVLLGPLLAIAQVAKSPAPTGADAPAAPVQQLRGVPPMLGMGPNGVYLGLPDSGFQLRIRGVVQADGRDYPDFQPRVPSSFFIRRARLYIEGTVGDFADFRLLPDFGQGQLQLMEAFVDLKPFEWARLMAGKFKAPFSLERLVSEQDLDFVERGLPSDLAPDRDVGVALHGEVKAVAKYTLAVVDGAPDAANIDGDVDDEKDLDARVFLTPLRELPISRWLDLGMGAALTWGREQGNAANPLLPVYRTSGQQPFFSYRANPQVASAAVIAQGDHTRFSPQGTLYAGPAGLLAELIVDQQDVRRGAGPVVRLTHRAWQVELILALTGERETADGLSPRNPFSLEHRRWGALELKARFGQLRIDPAAFPSLADPAQAAGEVQAWTLGANWYFTRNARLEADLDRAFFQGGAPLGDRAPQTCLMGRLQVGF